MTVLPSPAAPFGAARTPAAIIVSRDAAAAARLGETIAYARLELIATLGSDEVGRIGELRAASLFYVDIAMLDAAEAASLLGVIAGEVGADTALIVEFARAQIDAVGGCLMGSPATLLCDPTDAERIAAVTLANAGGRAARLGERSRDVSDERLKRLNDEVARIADTLARLTRGDGDAPVSGSVADRTSGYAVQPPAMLSGSGKAAAVRAILRARRLRDQHLGGNLFADPAWDMLLDLYAADIEEAQVSVSSLCIAAAVPPTKALRWIQSMHERGLFERREDPFDKRRAYIALSEEGRAAMVGYFAALGEGAPKVV